MNWKALFYHLVHGIYVCAILHSKYSMELISSKSLILTSALHFTVIQDWASLQEGVIHPV